MVLNLLTKNIESNLSNPKVFKFKTNAQKFVINYSIKDKINGNYPHLGVSAREGITVLYRKSQIKDCNNKNTKFKERTWYHVNCFTKRYNSTISMNHLVKPNEEYEVMIYGPILSKLETLTVDAHPDYNLEPIEDSFEKRMLVCGGLNSFGIGCTTSASTFSSIICRKFNASIDNISFNDKNFLDKTNEFFEKKQNKKYDVGILEVDYVNQDDKFIELYLENVLKIVSNCCDEVICWTCLPKFKEYKVNRIKNILKKSNANVYFKDLSFVYDEYLDLCTYSRNFINDSGNMIIYKEIEKILRSL